MLKKIFGAKRVELNTEFKIFHNEEPCDLYSPLNAVRVVKFRKMCYGHISQMGVTINSYRNSVMNWLL
jgi:hypothetical protein